MNVHRIDFQRQAAVNQCAAMEEQLMSLNLLFVVVQSVSVVMRVCDVDGVICEFLV